MTRVKADQLRRRKWGRASVQPIRFPAWRNWTDSRVRLDDAMLDTLAGLRLGRVAIQDRSKGSDDRVPDLFTQTELPYKDGFNVSSELANYRLADAEHQIILNAFPIYVAGFDALLGGTSAMLKKLGIGPAPVAKVGDTGVSGKLPYLKTHCGIQLKPPNPHLYGLLLEIRNSVVHSAATEARVAGHWRMNGAEPAAARKAWTKMASRNLPLDEPDGFLRLGDREIVACQRSLDQIALDLAQVLRGRVTAVDWGRLVIDELDTSRRALIPDPRRGPQKLRAWAKHDWGLALSHSDAVAACANPLPVP